MKTKISRHQPAAQELSDSSSSSFSSSSSNALTPQPITRVQRNSAQAQPNRAKRHTLRCAGIVVAGLLFATVASGATNDLTTTLQKGLFEEEANHNLGAAIQLYQSVVNQFDKDRKLAATAVFRLAECYRKQGNTNEANAQYDRVLREFADQTQLAALSRQNLAALGATPTTGATPALSNAARQEQKKLLEQEIALVEKKLASQKKMLEVGATNPDDLLPTEREILQLKRQMAALDAGATVPVTGGNAISQEAADARAEAAALKRKLSLLQNMNPEERRIAVQQEYPNPVLTSLMQKFSESEQNLVALNKEFGPNHSKVVEENTRLKTVSSQIDAQVNAVLVSLAMKQQEAETRAASLAQAAGTVPAREESAGQPSTSAEAEEIRRIQAMTKDSPDLINAKPDKGLAPLNSAASEGHLVVAQFLLDHGADVEVKEPGSQWTPIHFAAFYGHRAIVELLLSHKARANAEDIFGKTPLHLAAEKGFRSVVEVLLEHGANINAVDHSGATPLHYAVGNGFRSVTELLLAKGADPNVSAHASGTPLHAAVGRGDQGLVELLLANKADPNTTDREGKTPLDLAAASGKAGLAAVLLSHGAEVNTANENPNYRGWTALHYAVEANQKEIVDLLLKHKANPNAPIETGSISGPAPLNISGSAPLNPSAIRGYTPLLIACTEGYTDIVASLLEAKADPNVKAANGDIPVISAIGYARPRILGLLLEHGANPDVRNPNGETPLMLAAIRADKESLELLLSHKADPKARTPGGKLTALHWLFNRNFREWPKDAPEMAQDLIAAGTDVNAQDQQGRTPLNYIALFFPPPGVQPDPMLTKAREVLRKAGAVEDLARMDVIQIGRRSANWSSVVLWKGTNDYNHFTLFELLGAHYGFISSIAQRTSSQEFDSLSHTARGALQFPDLGNVVIRRPKPDRTEWTTRAINLSDIFQRDTDAASCSDEQLRWGDVVEIPEADHPISAAWQGLPEKDLSVLERCLWRQVQLTVKGSTTNIALKPNVRPGGQFPGYSAAVPSFYLVSVLYQSGMLRASSDLSRVKVSRRDPATGQRYEMLFDCSPKETPGAVPDLWLRDGDAIEVPEKP